MNADVNEFNKPNLKFLTKKELLYSNKNKSKKILAIKMCNSLNKKSLVTYQSQGEMLKKVKHGGSLPSRKVLSQMVPKDVFNSSMPIVVSEVKARYRFGVKSNKAQVVNWKGNIPVIKFNFEEEKNLNRSEHVPKKRHHHHHSSKKIKCGNSLLFKSATTEEIAIPTSPLPKPLKKKHHSCKGLNTVATATAAVKPKSQPKVFSVSSKQLPPPPKMITATTTKLIQCSHRQRPVQHVFQVQQYPAFPPFNIKLQFKL